MNFLSLNISTTALISIPMLICFFGLMVFIGFRCRSLAKSVDSFVLGRRTRVMTQALSSKTMPDFLKKDMIQKL